MQRVNKKLVQVMKLIELVIAVFLMIAIVISTIACVVYGADSIMDQSFQLEVILEKSLTLVVGVEFVKMLILHTPDSVIEVLLYAVARQIIISHDSALENLFGVMAVALIFVVKHYFLSKNEGKEQRNHENCDTMKHKNNGGVL